MQAFEKFLIEKFVEAKMKMEEGFEEGKTYYTVWCYTDRLPTLEDLKALAPDSTGSGVG